MADAGVTALVNELAKRLTSAAIQEFALLQGLKDDILSLKDDFARIRAVLEDAEEEPIKKKAEELRLKKLRSTSLKVENLLDEISTEALLQRLYKERGMKYRVRAFFSTNHNEYMFRVRIAHKVKAIRTKLGENASKKGTLKGEMPNNESKRSESLLSPTCDKSDVDLGVEGEMPDRETSSLIHDDPSLVLGRDKEREMVSEKICNKGIEKYENGQIQVYGIWGMGGVGKTTLAQLVYKHERVEKNFELKCWVYVSKKFQVKEIIKGVIESIDECKCELTHLDVLQKTVQGKLRGKKFLIVLDDVWIEDDEETKWDKLRATLSCGAEGSLVLMTTRSEKTSKMFAKFPDLQHKVGCLSPNDSWLLFTKIAFAKGRNGDGIDELDHIGRELVKKCEGLPLAVKTLGSLMWSKSSKSDWQRVKDSNIWELKEKILPALKLSYDDLHLDLKRCFAYCCLFPKGYEMEKDAVIQLWVVNGFISPRVSETDIYKIGEDIFERLVWRSFFQLVKANKYSNSRFKMHDLMHDLARHVMADDCFIIESTCKSAIVQEEVLHLSSSCPDEKFDFSTEELEKLTSLRSVFMFENNNEGSINQVFNFVYLRVLYLLGSGLKTLPKTICRLKYLKYLNLSFSSIEVLPESIICLQNLQVLLLYSCKLLCKLPEGMRYMSKLEALDINRCFSLMHLPLGIKELTKVRILSRFPVGRRSEANMGVSGEVNILEGKLEISKLESFGNSSEASIRELGDLNLLEGELEILGLENVSGLDEAKCANLKDKGKLLVLKLIWSDIAKRESKTERFKYDKEVLEGVEPSSFLKGLEINNYMGKVISPTWMTNLENLVEIRFSGCKNCEEILSLGRLPKLKVIYLLNMVSLKRFHDDDTNTFREMDMFLCVEKLHVDKCPSLVSLPSSLRKLKVLRLYGCDALVSLPIESFKYLNELEIGGGKHLSERYKEEMGADWPQISHIPIVSVYGEDDMIEDENEINEIDEMDE